ncbi:MAG: cysteine desulfurase [Bdellovibrionales bacterium]|nr:cysteine desulfurase [Bdellovibrionales bacterium]
MYHDNIRRQFPIFTNHDVVYLDSAASSQKPSCVIDEISDFYRTSYANVHRGLHHLSASATVRFENARNSIASFLHASSPSEIIFVRGLTEGMNLLSQTFGRMVVQEGQTILLSEMEHHSNVIPWMVVAKEKGAKIQWIPVLPSGDLDMESFKSMLDENVALISVVHISNVLGTINPIQEMAKLAKTKNIPIIVDGAQAAHHIQVDVQALGVDFYVVTGHKMYGPTGTGAIWGNCKHLEKMPCYQVGGEMVDTVTYQGYTIKEPPSKFEAGTPHIAGNIGFGKACEFITSIGWDYIKKHEGELMVSCEKALSEINGLRILGSAKQKIGVFSFEIDGCHPQDIGTLLDQENIAVRVGYHCAEPLHQKFSSQGTVRVSLGIYNNVQDIEKMKVSLHKVVHMLRG